MIALTGTRGDGYKWRIAAEDRVDLLVIRAVLRSYAGQLAAREGRGQ